VSYSLRIAEAATAELGDAVSWYDAQLPGLGAELLEAVARALDVIAENPRRGPALPDVAGASLRRLLVEGFPYQIIYEVRPTEIAVIAVAHLKRRPGYWKDRLGPSE
jgi:plasmid stabilization system protein ParE